MSAADVESAPPPPALPDYLLNPNAVLGDTSKWRYGRAPDYSNTRAVFEQTKKTVHEAQSLPSLVENLVKNWEIEASFKPELADWRTINHANYSFAINGGPPQTAEHMLEVGTYNAIIASNEFYSPARSDFASSHKTFKRMMPTFAWEVLEVYSGPPTVAFKWRHWGQMKNDYVGFNDKGEKITAKAHGGPIEIEGVTVATVDDQVRLQKVETWFDPLEMFRQIAPNGIVNKEVRGSDDHDEEPASVAEKEDGENAPKVSKEKSEAADTEEPASVAEKGDGENAPNVSKENSEAANKEEPEKRDVEKTEGKGDVEPELVKDFEEKATLTGEESTKSPQNVEDSSAEADLKPKDAIAAAPSSEETQRVHEEMSRITAAECPFLNQE